METENYEQDENGMVTIPFEIDDANLLILMKDAHKKDITFNKYMEQILTEYNEFLEKEVGSK